MRGKSDVIYSCLSSSTNAKYVGQETIYCAPQSPGFPLITQEGGIIGLVPYTPPDQYNQLFALITNQHESMTKDFLWRIFF